MKRKRGRPATAREVDMIATNLRMPRALADRLDAEARRRVIGRSLLVEILLEDMLPDYEDEEL